MSLINNSTKVKDIVDN